MKRKTHSSSCELFFGKKRHARGIETAVGRCGRIRSSWLSLDSSRHCCHLLFIVVSAPLGGSFHGIHIQIGPGLEVLNATLISTSLSACFARHQTCSLYCVTHHRGGQTVGPLRPPTDTCAGWVLYHNPGRLLGSSNARGQNAEHENKRGE